MSLWDQYVGFFSSVLQKLAGAFAFLGDHRWAAAIIALTLIVRTILLPLAMKQIKSMREQQRLQPEVARLRQKYQGDRQKMTEELMELYRREGVNPYAACIPMVAQMPLIIGIYQALRRLTMPTGDTAKQLAVIAKRSHQTLIDVAQQRGVVPKMPFLGLGDLAHPALSSVGGIMLIVLMTVAQLWSTQQLNVGQTDQQRRMQMLMPLFFVVLFIRFPAGLVLYWTSQTLYQLVQQMIMTRDTRPAGAGWRGLVGLKKVGDTKQRPVKSPPRPAPVAMAAGSPASSAASSGAGFEALAPRRDLAEKRARRRRRKKKKRKR
jgi:YidC/Oxa1 family membrane protein insertase